jgi:hypothetical protein
VGGGSGRHEMMSSFVSYSRCEERYSAILATSPYYYLEVDSSIS